MLRPPGTNANDRRPTRPCKGDSKGKHKDNGYRAGQPVRRAYITENDQTVDPDECQIRFPVDWLSLMALHLGAHGTQSMTMPVTQVLLDINLVKVIYVG